MGNSATTFSQYAFLHDQVSSDDKIFHCTRSASVHRNYRARVMNKNPRALGSHILPSVISGSKLQTKKIKRKYCLFNKADQKKIKESTVCSTRHHYLYS